MIDARERRAVLRPRRRRGRGDRRRDRELRRVECGQLHRQRHVVARADETGDADRTDTERRHLDLGGRGGGQLAAGTLASTAQVTGAGVFFTVSWLEHAEVVRRALADRGGKAREARDREVRERVVVGVEVAGADARVAQVVVGVQLLDVDDDLADAARRRVRRVRSRCRRRCRSSCPRPCAPLAEELLVDRVARRCDASGRCGTPSRRRRRRGAARWEPCNR